MIEDWKLSRDTTVLAQITKFKAGIAQNKVMSTALDGTLYLQTIGTGTRYADVEIVATREEMASVNQAESDGAMVQVVYREGTYLGYMSGAPEWEDALPGEWYTGSFKLLIEEVI